MQSKTETRPHKTSHSTMYRPGEAATDNPNAFTGSNLGTGKVTFTAEPFAVAVRPSSELVEDAIFPLVTEFRMDIAYSLATGYESVIFNGDSTATHFDTGASYTSINPETYEKGLRRLASDASKTFDVASTSAGVGDATAAFAAADWRYLKKLCGPMGTQPDEFIYATSGAGYFHTLNMVQFNQPGTYQAGNTWSIGALSAIDGSPLVISGQISESMNASGIYDASVTDYTVIVGFNKTGFMIGERRGVTIEFDKKIEFGQYVFVGTMRKSLQKMTPSTRYPVAVGYKVPN